MTLTANDLVRFWEKVNKNNQDQCWAWVGGLRSQKDKYGSIKINSKAYLPHRISWIIHNKVIPDGLCILHKCDNRLCVNPDHLFLGTRQINTQDMVHKNRQASGVRSGNVKLNEEQVLEIRDLRKNGITKKEIAKKYNICTRTVWRITKGDGWSSV